MAARFGRVSAYPGASALRQMCPTHAFHDVERRPPSALSASPWCSARGTGTAVPFSALSDAVLADHVVRGRKDVPSGGRRRTTSPASQATR